MELVGPILEVIKCFGGPTCRYLDNHRKLEENMSDLRRRVDGLNIRKKDIELRKDAELRSGKVAKKEVERWFEDVERINIEMQTIEQKLCDVSYFSRGRLGKLVCRKIKGVKEVHQQGKFLDGVAVDAPPTRGVILQTTDLEGEINVKEQIWEYLMGDEVAMIGVCGMGGIGKTTIMKHINNQLLKEAPFDKVIWVTVSKELNVVKLQEDIASACDMKHLLPKNELERATKLMDILKTKRYVLILDDVWKQFSLLQMGIPEPRHDGSKLVITSRSIDVCLSMGCKVLKVQPLSKEESLNLFLNHVGHGVLEDPALKEIVKLVVDQCSGLPLAIVTIAGSMKGVDDVREWRNALYELCERVKSVRGLDTEIFKCLMFSYDRLGDSKIQNCFLYCSLYPEDYTIERSMLIEKWIDEGLVDECGCRQAMQDRGHSILNKLENNCLLEKGVHSRGVKMHDVLRDMALSLKKANPRFMVKAGMKLKELPCEHEWTADLEKVSLMHNSISEIPPGISPKCESLSTLLVQGNHKMERISEPFFKHMPGLKVLDLSYTDIRYLPNSISYLENLEALVLRSCLKLRHVPSLAKLRSLRKLDLYYTAIEEVPHGMEMLTNLTYLALDSENVKELPMGILPKLSNLQYLVTTSYVRGEEMAKLRKLEIFSGLFTEPQEFRKYIKSVAGPRPTNYSLLVGSYGIFEFFQHRESYLVWQFEQLEIHKIVYFFKCSLRGDQDPVVLPIDLEALHLEECHDLLSLSYSFLFHDQANDLKHCYIWQCKGIQCLLDLSYSSCNLLQSIETLHLRRLQTLRRLVRVGVPAVSTSQAPTLPAIFSSLKVFYLESCSSMKKLFSIELVQGLQNLEELEVVCCEKMEEIITSEDEEEEEGEEGNHIGERMVPETTTFILPKLKKLHLLYLPELKSICSSGVTIHVDFLDYKIDHCQKLKPFPCCFCISGEKVFV
ncbi:LRR and NB-ARC domains-containing disease resistance protein, putative [Theobroma cacao]|uniref:LRR and NB-ARC domains-containing disease resistance protein, putative n=1 Tax=Theobroma cacao TaxID=3641 RepID=A0A061F631_THECC|nr:LRR and NB-ARC domains-containing disease resistance protein, putative [Theobroma cacao]